VNGKEWIGAMLVPPVKVTDNFARLIYHHHHQPTSLLSLHQPTLYMGVFKCQVHPFEDIEVSAQAMR